MCDRSSVCSLVWPGSQKADSRRVPELGRRRKLVFKGSEVSLLWEANVQVMGVSGGWNTGTCTTLPQWILKNG